MKHTSVVLLKSLILINIGVICGFSTYAQYYYNDIVAPAEYNPSVIFRKTNVAQVQLNSFEANGQPSEGFTGTITANTNYTQITSFTKSDVTVASNVITFYNAQGRIEKSVDSSAESVTRYNYQFNQAGKLNRVNSVSTSADGKSSQEETHFWLYNAAGFPEKMLRIRNLTDTTTLIFTLDANNNVEEEKAYRKGQMIDQVYYYYDDANRLTDVVRFNKKLQKLVPDFTFEYNEQGAISQKLNVFNGTDYLIWRYEYDSKGLKTRDLCYNKQKALAGRIEYVYTYR